MLKQKILGVAALAIAAAYGLTLPNQARAQVSSNFSSSTIKQGLGPRNLPMKNRVLARVFFDANGDGRLDYFAAEQTYNFSQTANTASKSNFVLFLGTGGGGFKRDAKLLAGKGKGCIHPRKAVVNDFNRDGKFDVFVVCHGWDKKPYPGERNKIVLSQSDGKFLVRDAADDIGFFHSGASADFNGDGNPDVITTNNFDERPVRVWLGDGKGGFRITTKAIPSELKARRDYFTVELPDVDGDGRFDLFVGGHEFGNAASTKVFLNKSRKGFRSGKAITIPAVNGQGVVLDAVATGPVGNRQLWILRTSGGGSSFYKGACVQRFDLATNSSKIAHCSQSSRWQPWLTSWKQNGRTYVGSDDASSRLRITAD